MKVLIVYYSYTGYTKKIANEIANTLNCDIEEIFEKKKSRGIIGWFIKGKNSLLKKATPIEKFKHEISHYDLIILGTPVWANTMASPVRTFLNDHKTQMKNLAVFITMGGANNDKNTINEIKKLYAEKLLASVGITAENIKKNNYFDKLKLFIDELNEFSM